MPTTASDSLPRLNDIGAGDRDKLRKLAACVREYAESRTNQEKVRIGSAMNALCPERPLVFTSPENAWNELIPETELECSHARARRWERQLRMSICWAAKIKCDRAVYPFLQIPWHIDDGNFGVPTFIHRRDATPGASMSWSDYPVRDLKNDLGKLEYRRPTVDRDATYAEVEQANAIIGDLLPTRIHSETYWWTWGLTGQVINLVGMENLMLFMCTDPEGVHGLMQFMADEQLHLMHWFQNEGLLSPNAINDNIGSGGPGHCDALPGEPLLGCRLDQMWGFGESQETVGISPGMFAEFILPHHLRLAAEFGLNYYGCCEPLDQRWEYVSRIPRLRRISVSPWARLETMASQLAKNYVLCRKVHPALVCAPDFDENAIRLDVRETLRVASHTNLEFILKDTHTIHGQTNRISRWVEIVREELDRWFG